MSSSANVGTAVIALKFDGNMVKSGLTSIGKGMTSSGESSGSKFANAWSVAVGNLMQKGISKAVSMVSSNIDNAISRVDTLNNFPKVMTNLGVASEESSAAISKMSEKLQGLPTNLDQGAAAVQRFTSKNNDVEKSTDMFLALNNAILAGGMSADIQSTAIEQISQAYAKGKPDMQEWRAIEVAMPAQLNQISKAMLSNKDALDDYMKRADKYAKDNPMSSTASELVEQLEGVKNGTFDMTTALGTALRTGVISMDEFMGTIQDLNKEGVDGLANFEQQAKDATGGIQTAIQVMNSRITQGIAAVIDEIGSENIAKIAEGIGNAVKDVGKVVANVVNFIAEHWDIVSPILGVLAGVAGIVVTITVALKAYHKVQAAVNAITAVFRKTIGGIHSGIAKVTGVFQKSPIGGAAEKVGGIFQKLADTIKSAVTNIGEILKSLVNAIMEPIKAVLQGVGEALAGFFEALASPAVLMGAVTFAAVAASIAAAIFLIGSAIGAVMPALTDLFNNIVMPMTQFLADTLLNLIVAITDAVVLLTQNAIIPLINTLSGAFVSVVQAVANLITGVLNAALQGIAEIIRAVGDGFLKMGEAIKTALEGVQGVLNAFAEIIKSIASAAVAIVSLVTGRSINYGSGYAHLFAEGGKVEGPGTSTSDSIPAMLSDGEYVINAQAARGIGYDVLDMLNDGDYAGFYSLEADFAADYGQRAITAGGGVTIERQEFNISNELDAQDIGRVIMQSIRRAA